MGESRGIRARYTAWKSQVADWASRHGISEESAMSIISDDSSYSPDGRERVTLKSLFWGEEDSFCEIHRKEKTVAIRRPVDEKEKQKR